MHRVVWRGLGGVGRDESGCFDRGIGGGRGRVVDGCQEGVDGDVHVEKRMNNLC